MLARREQEAENAAQGPSPDEGIFRDMFLGVKSPVNPIFFIGRLILFAIILVWGVRFIISPLESNLVGRSFLHLINLPFHEAGHIIFSFFGRFIMVLGGSLMQLLIPFLYVLTFLLFKGDPYGSAVCTWWLGESFMDLAPYINDARALKLILLGGVTGREVADYHDWEYLLRTLGWLEYDHVLANMSHLFGILLMLTAYVWGGMLLYKQFRNLEKF